MRIPTLIAACLLTALPAAAADQPTLDLPAWVASLGGSVEQDAAGRVTEVNLRGSWMTDLDAEALLAAPHIRSLDLSNTHITDVALESIAKLPDLRTLSLRYCEHITEAGVAHLRGAAKLERLDLRGAPVSDSGVAFLAQIPTLRALDIGITQITGPSFEALEALENLEELSIGGNRVSDLGLSYLQALPKLRKLDVSGSQITDSGVWGVTVTDVNLESIALLGGLEELNLAASDAEYIANIGDGVPRLRNMIEITDLGAARLTALKKLRVLNLSRSEITAAGLAELATLPALEALTLAHASRLGADAVPALLRLERLTTLDLTGAPLTDAGLARLAAHPALREIVALDTQITEAGAEELARLRPEINLIW